MTNEADKPGVRGFFKRLRAKLNTGPAWLTTDIKELLPGRKIDAEILDDLETRLISADVGVEAAARILGDLRKRVARKELDDVDALLKALHAAMLDILRPVEQPLHVDPNIRPYVILVVGINGAVGSNRASTRLTFLSSSMRCVWVCKRPAVSAIRTSMLRAFAACRPS